MPPRWHLSQREVERALADGPKTVRQIAEQTGLSYSTVTNCLGRAKTTTPTVWPRTYTLIESAFAGTVKPPVKDVEQPTQVVHIVAPLEIPMEELGPRWQKNARKLGDELAAIDLQVLDLKTAIKHLEVEAASILGAVLALRAVKDGPDWRSQIGLAP